MSTSIDKALQNPFPGLRPFREDEEHLFFGRENQVDAMVDKLARTQFLAVVGTSGSGKSSLVNSGLCPALRGGLMASAGTDWRIAQFRPGSDPVGAMSKAIARKGVLFDEFESEEMTLDEVIETTLRMSSLGSIDIYEQAQLDKDANLLIIVDQFEELFRYRQLAADPGKSYQGVSEEAFAFVNLILEATKQTRYPIYVVLTMRSDFLGDCAQFQGLAEAVNEGHYLVPRMTRDERRAAISGPVGVGGAQISPVLLTRLVNDVGDNPDQLSILQHALNRTWAQWESEGGEGSLDLQHYEAIGTMEHALDKHAEKAFAELTTQRDRQVCEKLFKSLTDKATDPRGIRRPTSLAMLCALLDASKAEVTKVVDVFRKPSRSFLMPPAGETLTAASVIDISHESLMRVWKRLDKWADEESRSARIYGRLAETATLHADGKANLWQDPELQLALDWREATQPNEVWAVQHHPGFAKAMSFLDASLEERDKQIRSQKRRKTLIAVAITFAALAILGAIVGYQQYALNEKQKDIDRLAEYAIERDHYVAAIDAIRFGKSEKALAILEKVRNNQKGYFEEFMSTTTSLHYSDTLTAIGNLKETTSEDYSGEEYVTALEIRKQLVDVAKEEEKPELPEFKLKLANAYMNVAIFEEGLGDDIVDDSFESAEAHYVNAETNYHKAQEMFGQLVESANLDDYATIEVDWGLGRCYSNLMGLYQGWADSTRNEVQQQDLDAKMEDYAQRAIEKLDVVLGKRSNDSDAVFTRALSKIALASNSNEFPAIRDDLEFIIKANPAVPKYKTELARMYLEWGYVANEKEYFKKVIETVKKIHQQHPQYKNADYLLADDAIVELIPELSEK